MTAARRACQRRFGALRFGPAILGPIALALALAAFGGEAEAQYFGDRPTGATRKSREGRRLGLSLRLLYQVPQFESRVSIDARQDLPGSSFRFAKELSARPDFIVPVFEAEYDTGDYGRFVVEYQDLRLRGTTVLASPISYDGMEFPRQAFVRSRYEFRTVNVVGYFGLPLDESINLDILAGVRWVHWFSSLTSPNTPAVADDTTDTAVPSIGIGGDVLIIDALFLYGQFSIIGYSIDGRRSELLLLDDSSKVFVREWRAGLRYEVFDWISLEVEVRSLELRIRKSKATYRQDYGGLVFGIEVGF